MIRKCRTENYNWNFDTTTGAFIRWGKKLQDDPNFSPAGCEIADIEITTACNGVGGKVCPYCYKANTPIGDYMSFELFKHIFDKLPKNLTQIAFGVDAQCESNPDVWKIMEYSRANNVIPNVTVADISDEVADKLVKVCGAVAVSRHHSKDICYDSIKKLTDRGLKQTNMHIVVSVETYNTVKETIYDMKNDERLKDMNAVVFLALKQKGRGQGYTPLDTAMFQDIIKSSFDAGINFGFDSCSAPKFMHSVEQFKSGEELDMLQSMAESCESTRFSMYINTLGEFFPCSFTEGTTGWEQGIDLTKDFKFMDDVWYNPRVVAFRNKLIKSADKFGMCKCPVFDV